MHAQISGVVRPCSPAASVISPVIRYFHSKVFRRRQLSPPSSKHALAAAGLGRLLRCADGEVDVRFRFRLKASSESHRCSASLLLVDAF